MSLLIPLPLESFIKNQLTYVLFALFVSSSVYAQNSEFQHKKAIELLGLSSNIELLDVRFIDQSHQWIIYDNSQALGKYEHVYLLPENFNSGDQIITIMDVPQKDSRLIDRLSVSTENIEILSPQNGSILIKNEVPSIENMRHMAYENYDVLTTGWRFLENGLSYFPIYNKVKSIYDNCESLIKLRKKENCYKKEQKILALEILKSTLENDPSNKTLIEYLKDKDQSQNITKSFLRVYQDSLESKIFLTNYDWSEDSIVSGYSGNFLFHYTIDLTRRAIFYSPGTFWWKPQSLSVRYGYYPISVF